MKTLRTTTAPIPMNLAGLAIAIQSALEAEKRGDLDTRNARAVALFTRKNREVSFDGFKVRTWWDRYSRNYITETFTAEDFEARDVETGEFIESHYTGHADDAAVAHLWALACLFNLNAK